MTYPFECPHCKHESKYTGDCLEEAESTETECCNCGKTVEVTCNISVTYIAICLEADHRFKDVEGMAGYVECKHCGQFKSKTRPSKT